MKAVAMLGARIRGSGGLMRLRRWTILHLICLLFIQSLDGSTSRALDANLAHLNVVAQQEAQSTGMLMRLRGGAVGATEPAKVGKKAEEKGSSENQRRIQVYLLFPGITIITHMFCRSSFL
jgi:hypothetical protein